uniref:Putative secreted protein n=1 Tax=Ixodes ricinus TaxID=34613 RepID=A0A6B0U9A4_IXORI
MFLCLTSEVPIVFLVASSLPPVPGILWSARTVLDHSRYLEVWSVGKGRETVPWMFCFVSGDVIVCRCVAMLVRATCSACRLECVCV